MDKKINIEKLIKKASEKYPDEMNTIDQIDESTFDRIEKKALESFYSKKERKPWGIVLKTIAAVAAIFILFTATLVLAEVPAIRAYKVSIEKLIFNLTNDKDRHDNTDGKVVEAEKASK